MRTVEQENPLLTRKEAAEYLGVKVETLSNWALNGRHQLPYVKLGHRIRYYKSDLDDLYKRSLKSGEPKAKTSPAF